MISIIEAMPILLALEENPLMSLSELTNKLNISWPTLKKRYDQMVDSKIIRNPIASYKPEVLGLQRINVVAFVPNLEALISAEEGCRQHPHTVYRSRILSRNFGIFIQFNIPKVSLDYLIHFLEKLKEKNILSEYSIYPSSGVRYDLYPNLRSYEPKNNHWTFSWEEWVRKMDNNSEIPTLPSPSIEINTDQLKENHFEVLKLLTKNASITQKDLMQDLGFSKSSAFRYYRFVMENMISSVKLNFNRERFNLSETYLFLIKNLSDMEISLLYDGMIQNPPPFRFSIDIIENNCILIWGHMPSNHLIEFCYSFWTRFPLMEFFTLVTKDEGAASYPFFPPNYDFKKKQWKNDIEYMVEEPIYRLERGGR